MDITNNPNFAIAWLYNNNKRIYIGQKRILKCDFETWYAFKNYMNPLKYSWEIGKEFYQSTGESRVLSPTELRERGWKIVFNREKEKYFLKLKESLMANEYEPLPLELNKIQIEYKDTENEMRIKEKDGKTWPWKRIDRGKYDKEKIKMGMGYDKAYQIFFQKEKREVEKRFEMREGFIPVLKTRDNLLICIPIKDVDPIRIVIIGTSGHGKSRLTGYLCSAIFWADWKNSNFLLFNDCLDQFHSMMLPSNYWFEEIEEFGIKPHPLPTINLYLGRNARMRNKNVSFRYVVDSEYFYENYIYFSDKVDAWRLNPQYLQYVISHLTKEKPDKERISDMLVEKMGFIDSKGNRKGVPLGMINKFTSGALNIYEAGFLNICYNIFGNPFEKHSMMPGKWRFQRLINKRIVEEFEDRALVVAMEANLVPVFNTAYVVNEPWFKNLIADEMKYILEYQKGDKSKKRLYIFVDEMTTIYQTGSSGQDKASFEAHRIIKQGRFNDTGFIINLQSYYSLHQDIKDNLGYLFVGSIQSDPDYNAIKKNYVIDREQMMQLDTLQRFEFALFRKTNSPVLAYNKYGRVKDVSKKKMFIGMTIPPTCRHLPASKKLKKELKSE